jgi:xanthine dehydrogenase accessory factor
VEAHTTARLAKSAGYEVIVRESCRSEFDFGREIDPFTAVVLLHHDLDQEAQMLQAALRSTPFYIGALGSTRTHRRRVDRLIETGFTKADLNRIKAPIGVFGPTRDSTSLALSVLADVAAGRLAAFG